MEWGDDSVVIFFPQCFGIVRSLSVGLSLHGRGEPNLVAMGCCSVSEKQETNNREGWPDQGGPRGKQGCGDMNRKEQTLVVVCIHLLWQNFVLN